MRKVSLCIVIATSVLACACSDVNDTTTFRRSVYLTKPVQVSGNKVKIYSGIVEAAHEINLGFKTAGQISRIYSKEGDYVRKACRCSMTNLRTRQNGRNSCSSLKACQPTIMKRLLQA